MEYRYAASAIIVGCEGKVLLAQRSPNKSPYPGEWSLPSTYVRNISGGLAETCESEEEMKAQLIVAVERKLGILIELSEFVGGKTGAQNGYVLRMADYFGKVVFGSLNPNGVDYSAADYYEPVFKLGFHPKGFCTQVLMERIKEDPDFLVR